MSGPIRVLIADDQGLFREGLRALLDLEADIDVVGEACDGREAIAMCEALEPDVALMDLRMPGTSGIEATAAIRERAPSTRILVLTTFDDDVSVFEAIAAGAIGYLLKNTSRAGLVEAVRSAARGDSPIAPRVASKLVARIARMAPADGSVAAATAGVSARELDILRHLARGASNKEIATALRIAEGTVKNHLTSIFEKLDVPDRTQAALRARELGIA